MRRNVLVVDENYVNEIISIHSNRADELALSR